MQLSRRKMPSPQNKRLQQSKLNGVQQPLTPPPPLSAAQKTAAADISDLRRFTFDASKHSRSPLGPLRAFLQCAAILDFSRVPHLHDSPG